MAPQNLARQPAPLPVPGVSSRAVPKHELRDPVGCQALACGSALGADRFGHSSSDAGA